MTKLYRMLILVITKKLDELKIELQDKIRQFRPEQDPENNDPRHLNLEVAGFWNFMLEIVFNLYVVLCYTLSIVLIAMLALVFYPLNAVLLVFASLTGNITGGLFMQNHEQTPTHEKDENSDLVIVKKNNDKEK